MLKFGGFVMVALVVACSSSEDGGSKSNQGPSSNGQTSCGGLTCQAGQYCLNDICVPGCTSDLNCASNQTCEKNGNNEVGSCKNVSQPASKDCAGFVEKCTACGRGQAECTQACGVITQDCISCILETSGCDSAACDSTCGSR